MPETGNKFFSGNKSILLFLFPFLFLADVVNAQDTTSLLMPAPKYVPARGRAVAVASAAITVGTISYLYKEWYKEYKQSKLHSFNDNAEWLQMDKAGHLNCTYNISWYYSDIIRWTGADNKTAVRIGAGSSFLYMTTIELLDGISNEWGFSWGDMIANTSGCAWYVLQDGLWKEQRIRIKESYHRTSYAQYRPNQLGSGEFEKILKDYNGQTYWLSCNISSFVKNQNWIPLWLNLSLGYGAEGMTGALQNPAFDKNGNALPAFDRIRKYYVSFDIDLSKIKTQNSFLKTLFYAAGIIKIPFPALEYNSNGKMKFHPLYF